MSKRLFLSAGEASGDLHAANLVRAIQELPGCADWSFVGLGGEQMQMAGVELCENLVERSVMGFRKVVAEMGALVDVAARFLDEIERHRPDAVVLVDYPGLNLNLARMARAQGIPVIYYICPQVWAWAPWRLRRIARRCDLLLVILPFEERLYREVHSQVHFVGNPVFDHLTKVETVPAQGLGQPDRPILALYPGSRRQEVAEALHAMLITARQLVLADPQLQVIVSCQRSKYLQQIEAAIADFPGTIAVQQGSVHDLQRQAHLALVVSGTATLEQAFFGVPLVVVYPVKVWERRVFSVFSVTPHIALVNLFAGEEVVPEVLFTEGEEDRIFQAAVALLAGAERERVVKKLQKLRAESFQPGGAERAALQVVRFLSPKSG